MSELHVRSDSVDVEQIMKQIRARIREKRGSDYTEAELQQLASVKLEQFADPSALRSDLLEQFRQRGSEPVTYHRHHGVRRWVLMALHPLLKSVKKQLMADLNLYFEIVHNLVVEATRLGIEVQNLKMRVESLSSRVDFDERRGRALESVVQYRPDALPRQRPQEVSRPAPSAPPAPMASAAPQPAATPTTPGDAAASVAPVPGQSAPIGGNRPNDQNRPDGSRRRRRRRRRRPGQTMGDRPMGGGPQTAFTPAAGTPATPVPDSGDDDGPAEHDEDDGA